MVRPCVRRGVGEGDGGVLMKLRYLFDILFVLPIVAFKASREEEQNRRLAGM